MTAFRMSHKRLLALFIVLIAFGSLFAQFGGGHGIDASPYLIANATHLNNIRLFPGAVFRQTADIYLDSLLADIDVGWTPIGFYAIPPSTGSIPFTGKFYGDGYVIYNLRITRPGIAAQAMFAYASGATFFNMRLYNCDITGSSNIGGIVASGSNNSFTNCRVTGMLTGTYLVGGLCGSQSYSTFYLCSAGCNVTGTGSSVGGMVGSTSYCTITDCYSTRTVTGNGSTGGLIGNCSYSTVTGSYSTANVNGDAKSTGGLAGRSYHSDFTSCYATGDVSGGPDVGGFGGHYDYTNLLNCFARGNVTGWGNVGGLIGTQCVYTNLTNTYSTGFVSSTNPGGGLTGRISYPVTTTNSYWDIQTSGLTTSASGGGRTTDEMTYIYGANTYLNWEFYATWLADSTHAVNDGYPYLCNMPVTPVDDEWTPPVQSINLTSYPNPFRDKVTLSFDLPKNGGINLKVYNTKGQLVKRISESSFSKGRHEIVWDGKSENGSPAVSGVYFLRMQGDGFSLTRKLLLVK